MTHKVEQSFPGNGFQPYMHLSGETTVQENRRDARSSHTNVTVADLRIVTTIHHYRCKFTTITQRLGLHLTFSFHTRLRFIAPVLILSLINHSVPSCYADSVFLLAILLFSSLVTIHMPTQCERVRNVHHNTYRKERYCKQIE